MENGCESHPKLLNISVCEQYLDSVVVCCISLKRCWICPRVIHLNLGNVYRRLRGIDPQSGNRFRLRFVFVSCVRASGRGEAVWVCERGVFVNAGAQNGERYYAGNGFTFYVFAALCIVCFCFVPLYRCYLYCFVGFLFVLMLCACFFYGFRRQATIS